MSAVLGGCGTHSQGCGSGTGGSEAAEAEGLSPRFHQLDINDLQSIRVLRDFLCKEYGGLDVLVNNAAITPRSKWMGVPIFGWDTAL